MNANPSARPCLVSLETRQLMDAKVDLLANGILSIECQNTHDTVGVRQTQNQIVINQSMAYPSNRVSGIIVRGNGGNDRIDLEGVNKPATIEGGSGDDWLVGGVMADKLVGGGDQDTLFGMSGNDTLYGESGRDKLFGGDGNDSLYGGSGTDFLDDGNRLSQEFIDSGPGADFIADIWVSRGTKVGDIVQGQSGTCSFLSGLAAGCDGGIDYTRQIVYRGYDSRAMGIYDVTLWNPATSRYQTFRVGFDGTRNSYDTSTAENDSGRVEEFEFWPLLMQRAYLHGPWRGNTNLKFGLESATGGNAVYYARRDQAAKADLVRALNLGRAINAGISNNTLYGINHHALAVVGARGSFNNLQLLIYNPWGKDAQGKGETVALDGANDGYFWISWDIFSNHFDGGFMIR